MTFLGTGDAFHSESRLHSCYLLDTANSCVAVDFGATAMLALRRIGFDPRRIAHVVVTHLHGDHVAGLPFLVLDGVYRAPRTEPLDLVGPTGFRERLDLLLRAAYDDLAAKAPFEIRARELAPGGELHVGPLQARGFAADHMDPPHRPLSVRLSIGATSIAFSGDTQWSDDLAACADGADLLIAECTGLRPPIGRHLTLDDWRERRASIRARRVVLSHVGLGVAEAAREAGFEVAEDGASIELESST